MSIEQVNLGGAPNDGTGDPLRTAFDKVNKSLVPLDSTAYAALTTAWSGTAGVNRVLPISVAGTILSYQGLTTAWSGTNLAYRALQTAWSGTAGVNQTLPIAVAGTNLAALAYTLAQQGTVSHQVISYSSTIAFDMAGAAYQSVTVTGPAHITVTNPAMIRPITGRLLSNSGGNYALTWTSEFSSYGSTLPNTLPIGKKVMASFTSFGSTLSDVEVAAAVKI